MMKTAGRNNYLGAQKIPARRFRSSPCIAILAGMFFLLSAQPVFPQRASDWRVFKREDGLAESACVSVSVSPRGQTFVTHPDSNFVSVLDGYDIKNFPAPEAEHGRIQQGASGQLWTAAKTGMLEFKDGKWIQYPVSEMASEYSNGPSGATGFPPLYPVRQSHVIFLLRDRLMELTVEDSGQPHVEVLRKAAQSRLGLFCSLTIARDGGLWIGGEHGLARMAGPARNLNPKTEWNEFILPAELNLKNIREPEEDATGTITALAETSDGRQDAVLRFDGKSWKVLAVRAGQNLRAWSGPDKSCWVATGTELLQIAADGTESGQPEIFPAHKILDVAVEPDGVFWLATSEGLLRHSESLWARPDAISSMESPVTAVAESAGGPLWFVADAKLHRLDGGSHFEYPLPQIVVSDARSTCNLFPLPNGTLLLRMDNDLLQFTPEDGKFQIVSPADGAIRHPLGLLKDGNLCFKNSTANGEECRLEIYNGRDFTPFPVPSPAAEWCASFTVLFAAQNGDVWLSGERGIARLQDKTWQLFPRSDKNVPAAARAFAEYADGKIVCVTDDKLWVFDGRNWLAERAGFVDIHSLLRARDGSLWVGTADGLNHFVQGTWIPNGGEDGLASADIRQLMEDRQGRLWAGTTHGLSLFHPETDADAPLTFIHGLDDARGRVPKGAPVTLTLGAEDRWKFTPPARLLYSYRLDDREWSPFQEMANIWLKDLPVGKHYFQARTMDRNGNVSKTPAQLEFAVIAPWYEEGRLILIAFIGLAVALFFAAIAVNRHLQLRRSYAEVERKVVERTRELEIANRELLHSQKMNALGTLAAGIAHDFNNILSIVKGSAQIIEDNLGDRQKTLTRLDRIKTVVQQGAGIVEAMLGFSRNSDQPAEPCNVNAIVDDTITLLGDRFLHEVKVSFEREENLPEIPVARDFVQQILLNFIFNAAESMNEQKRVIITTRKVVVPPGGMVLLPVTAANYIAISVKDHGCGVSPENMVRIFEPFFTTKALSTRRGTGLGLSMVYELAKKLEAGIAVESVVGQGSEFTIFLPVREPEPVAGEKPLSKVL
jgi:signal transduction histidine kinase/ligand-binding sensor domain-containing protein